MIVTKKFSRVIKASIMLGLGMGFSSSVLAGGVAVNLLAGGSVIGVGHDKDVIFPPETFRTDTFNANGNPVDFAVAGGITYDVVIGPNYNNLNYLFHDVLLGVNGYYNQTSRDGTVLEYGLTDFANSTYNMHVKSGRLMLDTELDFHPLWKNIFTPFVELGLGIARNTLSFKNNPLPNIGADGGYYSLSDHSQTQFAYEVGAGIKVPINNHLVLSARYLYANAGNAESDTLDGNTGVILARPIKVSVDSQSILLGLSYLLG